LARRSPAAVEIKGFGNDVNIILNADAAFSAIEAQLLKKLKNSDKFLAGVEVILDTGERVLNTDECGKLKEIITGKFGLVVSNVRCRSEESRTAVEEIGWNFEHRDLTEFEAKEKRKALVRKPPDEKENDTVLIKRTFRSGQKELHRANVVIVGDVNPGAEVVATGDVVVMGALRGVAHAGADGDDSAVIIALDLSPIQLRISEYIGRPPDLKLKTRNIPEIARVEDGSIVIEKLR